MINRHRESDLIFDFPDHFHVIKFDDSTYFQKRFKKLQGSKAIDFLAHDTEKKILYLIEVKNFRDVEIENKERLKLNSPNSVALEVSLKVRDTLSCCVGAHLHHSEEEVTYFFDVLAAGDVTVKVILFLEGRFLNLPMIFAAQRDSMKKQLSWLTTKVSVENIACSRSTAFSVSSDERRVD